MRKNYVKLLAYCLCFCIFLGGCAGKNQKDIQHEVTGSSKIQIGFCFDSFVIERWLRDRDVFERFARMKGAEVNVQNANGDVEQQIAQIDYCIKKQVDVLVIIAVDGKAISEVTQKAKAEGIKIIAYDRLIENADVDLYLSFDNEEVGRLMGEAMAENLPKGGNIFMIKGPVTDHNVSMVEEGFLKAIDGSGLNIVYSANCAGWLSEIAYDEVNKGLEKTRDIAGVMCGNDDLANQAFRALAENRMAGKVVLVGQDGDLSACQRIVEGTQAVTVYKSVDLLAKTASEYAVKMGKGEEIKTDETIYDGSYNVPYMKLMPIAVNKENMQKEIRDSDFHSAEDVYLNVKDL